MRVVFFPVNNAWGLIFGQDVATATVIDLDGKRLWSSREDLLWDLGLKRLSADSQGTVSVKA